jgi:hypothetical protein
MCDLRQLGNALAQKEAIPVNSPGRRQKESRVRGSNTDNTMRLPHWIRRKPKTISRRRVKDLPLRRNGSTGHTTEKDNPKYSPL